MARLGRYGLRATNWIVEVNGVRTPDLDSFLATVAAIADAQVRVE
jgi:pro-apoptotic serine protease NMA111